MQVAIVDDRAEDRAELRVLLSRYAKERGLLITCDEYDSAEAFLAQAVPGEVQLLFLDIYMGELSGMEAARQVCSIDPECRLVFFTTSHLHAVESYEVRAAYYLTKPLEYGRLCQALDQSCQNLLLDSRRIEVHAGGVPLSILLSEIIFTDCYAGCPRLHLKNRIIVTDERASEIFATLSEDERFLNCNRNLLVNMEYISMALKDDFLLSGGERVPIRQRGCASVKWEFLAYSLKSLRKGNEP